MESVSAMASTKPLTKDETKILLSFIESSKIIYDKTNATTNKLKNEEWKRISDQFNALVTTSYRTPQQLRLKWENLKKNSRKRNIQIRMNNIKTGGGGPSYIPLMMCWTGWLHNKFLIRKYCRWVHSSIWW